MTRPLSSEKQNTIVSLLQKGWSTRRVAKWLTISQSSVERIQKKRLLDAQLSSGGRLPLISDHLRRACVRAVTSGGVSTATEACKLVRQQFDNEMSVQTVRCASNFASLKACVQKKKPLLS